MTITATKSTGVDLYHLVGSSVTAELAVRASDGARFKRYQDRTPQGYRWTAWETTSEMPHFTPSTDDPTLWGATGHGWRLSRENASVRLPKTDAAVVLSGWVGVAFMRVIGCDGTVEVRVRPNDSARVSIVAGVDVYGVTDVRIDGAHPAKHAARFRAIGAEALRQMLAMLGAETCAYLATLRDETRAAGPEWSVPEHLPCSLTDYSHWRVIV